MTTFAGLLKQLLGGSEEFRNAKYIGRACYVPLPDGNKIKAEFITLGVADHYSGLRLSVINTTDGAVDTQVLRFADYCDPVKLQTHAEAYPHIWTCENKPSWYVPMQADAKVQISDAANEFVSMYSHDESIGMNM